MAADRPAPRCPHCRVDLREVSAEAALGYCVVLDQCPQCGGVWCDRWELYPITAAAAGRLDAVDGEALRQPAGLPEGPLECPRCRARLQDLRDPLLPADTCVARCPNCDGLWLNRGQLRRVKSMTHRVVSGSAPRPDATAIEELAPRLVAPQRPMVRDLSRAFEEPPPAETEADLTRGILSGMAVAIARGLLRLLLHI